MKVFSCPDEVKYEQLIWNSSNFGSMKEFNEKRNEENKKHQEKLKQWLIDSGYNGENTGKVYNHQVGDGYASYMFADGKTSCLIHLPYDDEYPYFYKKSDYDNFFIKE